MLKKNLIALACTACFAAPLMANPGNGVASPTTSVAGFTVHVYKISGNRTISTEDIEKILTPYTGKVSLTDIQRAAEAIQAEYLKRGYVATTLIPPQDITGGTVEIMINEWAAQRIEVQGSSPLSKEDILERVPSILNADILNKDDMENELAFANLDPFRKYKASLRETDNGERIIDVEVIEPDSMARTTVIFDNTGTEATGRHRVTGVFQKGDALFFDNTLTVMATASVEQPEDVSAFVAAWRAPIISSGWVVDGYLGMSSAQVTGAATIAGDLNFVGDSWMAGVSGTRRLPNIGMWHPRLIVGLDYKSVDNTCSVGGYGDICGGAGIDVASRTAHLGISAQRGGEMPATLAVSLHRNLPGSSNNDRDTYANARFGAKPDFTVLRAHGNMMHVPAAMKDWTLSLRGQWQHSGDALVSSEQIGIGGAQTVRGYRERELAGDAGGQISLEATGPQLMEFEDHEIGLRPVLFMDYGWAKRNHALPGEINSATIASAGFGLTSSYASPWGRVSLRLNAGQALRDGSITKKGDWRVHFNGSVTF